MGYFLEKEGSTMHDRLGGKGTFSWLPFAGLALLTLLVGAFAVSCGGTTPGGGAGGTQAGDGEDQASVDLDHPALGDENAPVVLTEYADYQ